MTSNKHAAIAARDVPALVLALRSELKKNENTIPSELKDCKAWLCYRTTQIQPNGKFNKIPVYPRSGKNRNGIQGSPEDLENLGTWADAWQRFSTDETVSGVGFATLPAFGVVALDADHCVTNDTIRDDVERLIPETYAEFSPSTTGIRAFWLGSAKDGKNHVTGFELFHAKGFVTVTGDWVNLGPVPPLTDSVRATLESLCQSVGKVEKINAPNRLKEVAADDLRLQAIRSAGLYERDMGDGKHSICCPFEHLHSDAGRAGGDGDTIYYQPNTHGYQDGWIHCLHTHSNDQAAYWSQIGFNPLGAAVKALLAGYADPTGGGWPDPQPIPDDLPPVPAFDLELLPVSLRPWIEDIAERMQISPDIPAIGAVTALSAAIGRRMQIMPKAHDDWTVVPNLWGAVVAPPGYMKSPALSEVMRPLHQLENEAHRDYESALATWTNAKERLAIANSAAKAATLQRLKKDPTAEITATLSEPDEPIATRYCVNNFSMEALGEVLLGNPNGLLAFSDEIHGLLMMAQKPGNEGLSDFLLSAWNGDGAFTFDRIGRGLNRRIDHCCVAVLGGIQPGRLVEHVIGATHGGSGDSGLMQRFQLLTWPDLRQQWKLVDRSPNQEAREAAYSVFRRAVGNDTIINPVAGLVGARDPNIRKFDTEAQSAFYVWLEALESELRSDKLPTVMASHLSKYRSLVPSLALIFAVSDNITGAIPVKYVKQAVGWADYLRPHAERAYSCTTRPDTRHARALLAKITDGSITEGFKPADVYLKGWSLLDRPGTAKATDLLTELGHLLPDENRSTGGRPSLTFHINPQAKS